MHLLKNKQLLLNICQWRKILWYDAVMSSTNRSNLDPLVESQCFTNIKLCFIRIHNSSFSLTDGWISGSSVDLFLKEVFCHDIKIFFLVQYHAHVYTVLSVGVYTHAPEFSLLALSVLTTTALKKKKKKDSRLRLILCALNQWHHRAYIKPEPLHWHVLCPPFPKRSVQKKNLRMESLSTVLSYKCV